MKFYEYQRLRLLSDLGPNLSGSIFLNFFPSITTRPIEAKFHVEPPWDGGTKVCSNGPGHMTKMAALPIYGKNIKGNFLWNRNADDLETWYTALSTLLEYYYVCSNDAPGLTLNYFTTRSNLVHYAFVWEKVQTMDFFRIYCILWYEVRALWVPKAKVIHWPWSESLTFNSFKLLFLNNRWF